MNKKHQYIGILTASMLIIMSCTSIVHASPYDIFWGFSVSPKGNVWKISTVSPVGVTLFSGKDINPNTIEATIWHYCQNNQELHSHIVEPKQIVLTEKFIILVFDKEVLPKSAEWTKVTGTFTNEIDTFSAIGPSFVVCLVGCGPTFPSSI